MTELTLITRTIEQKGLVLPWERVERYGPNTMLIATAESKERPSKGTVLESGEVFVPYDVLWEVAERTTDDYIMGLPIPSVGYHEKLALVKAGLAVEETRGGIHGTDKLREFLEPGGEW